MTLDRKAAVENILTIASPSLRAVELGKEGNCATVFRRGGGHFRIFFVLGDDGVMLNIEIDDWDLVNEAVQELMLEAYPGHHTGRE